MDDLKPAPYNPRSISDEAAAGLGASMAKFGDLSGIVWNARTGNLVAGHQRVTELRKRGAVLEGDSVVCGGKRFPVRVVDWPLADEQAANLAANNPAIAGEFTPDIAGILDAVRASDAALFEALRLGELEPVLPVEVTEDEAPEPPKTPVTKPGDAWTLGRHRVVCGDCAEVLLPGPYELLVTDPPYGVDYSSKNEFLNTYDKGNRNQTPIENDAKTPGEMSELWTRWFSALRKFASPGASYYVTGPQGGDLLLLLLALREGGFPLRHMLVWCKNNHVLGRCDYNYKHEPILFGWVDGAAHRFYGGEGLFSTWEIDRPSQSKLHPTMKPVALFAKAIGHSSKPGDIVCDPFLGSGTTLVAAEQLGRTCYGIEISPAYCDVVVERWQTLTGGKATRAGGV